MRPHVQDKAVLAAREGGEVAEASGLHAHVPELLGLASASPARPVLAGQPLRFLPSSGTRRRHCVRDSLEDVHAVVHEAFHGPALGVSQDVDPSLLYRPPVPGQNVALPRRDEDEDVDKREEEENEADGDDGDDDGVELAGSWVGMERSPDVHLMVRPFVFEEKVLDVARHGDGVQ